MPYFFCLCTEIISVSRIGTFLALTRDYGFDEYGVFYPAFL